MIDIDTPRVEIQQIKLPIYYCFNRTFAVKQFKVGHHDNKYLHDNCSDNRQGHF